MNRLLLVTIILGLFPSGIYAQNYNPKFDEGPDLAEFLKAAREESSLQTCMPFPPVRFETVKTVSINDVKLSGSREEFLKFKAGSYFGPLRPSVTGNKAYPYAQKYPPLIQPSQDPVAKELMIQWKNIENARVLLLDEAQALELKDAKLYADGEQIAQNAVALNKEIEAWKADVAAYNAECAGQPANDKCTAERDRLLKWKQELEQAIATHNVNYDAWKARANELTGSVNNWKSKLKSWEQAILYFIEKAQAFLKDTGNCTPEQHAALQLQVTDACKVPNQLYVCEQWNPGDPTKDCVAWREMYALNQDCYYARHRINEECYDGGNPTHQDEELWALIHARDCMDLIKQHCTKSSDPAIPGRRYGAGF